MDLTIIKGINEKRKIEFSKLGVNDTADLIRFFPKTYLDLRAKQSLQYAYDNEFTLTSGTVIALPNAFMSRRNRSFVKVLCEQDGLHFYAVWFNQPYVLSKLQVGTEYLFYGRVSFKNGLSIINPTFEEMDKNYRLKGIVPQYACNKGALSQKIVRDAIRLAVNVEKPKSIIPERLQKKYGLMDLYDAYKYVHNPSDFEMKEKASERIAVEEYFALISAFRIVKGSADCARINYYNCSAEELLEFISRFPFEFTDGQKQAVNQIFASMRSNTVMNRLLQGDVGCGKTAVSLVAMFVAVKSGYQVVMLAPTEVLARQNYENVKKYFQNENVDILTGSLSVKEKNLVKSKILSGETSILVGTHAVLEEDVKFKNLSLCVCDEQQRFGVSQRSSLLNKGVLPDVLVMSATPIPRTLALIVYGDLEISTILDKPKDRQVVQTNLVPEHKYAGMLEFIREQIAEGRQAYFVSPKIEEDVEGELMSVTALEESLSQALPDVKLAVMHGKMKDKEKNEIMLRFKNGEIQGLISTTVIEVGVDVGNASIMVIYNAERFGLSQLHQLRGRVGRSSIKSYCFLLSNKQSDVSKERLNVFVKNSDGFKIAEADFSIRGAGDFMGERQSGKFMHELGLLQYGPQAIFLSKKICDEAFELGLDFEKIKEVALKKYNKLKNITMN